MKEIIETNFQELKSAAPQDGGHHLLLEAAACRVLQAAQVQTETRQNASEGPVAWNFYRAEYPLDILNH